MMMASIIVLADNNALSLTASFGVAEHGETVEDLLNHADAALYFVKNAGLNHLITYCAKTMRTPNLVLT